MEYNFDSGLFHKYCHHAIWGMWTKYEKEVCIINAQFRNLKNGYVYKKSKKLEGIRDINEKNQRAYIIENLKELIRHTTKSGKFKFIPYEDIIYNFNTTQRLGTIKAIKIFNKEAREEHEYYRDMIKSGYRGN